MMPLYWLAALISGLLFGLGVSYGVIGQLVMGIGAAVLVLGVVIHTMFRGVFALALLGFMLGLVAGGGLSFL